MKKHFTTLVLLLAAGMMLSIAACAPTGTPSKPDDPNPDPGPSGGSESSSAVPGLGTGEFVPDYDFDYNPYYEIPEANPNKEIELVIDPAVKATFAKDGGKSIKIKSSEMMPEIKNETGLEIVGWYDVSNPYLFWSADGRVPKLGPSTTIAPYTVMPGTDLNVGHRSNESNTEIAESDSKVDTSTYTLNYARAVVGNYLGYYTSFNYSTQSSMKYRYVTEGAVAKNTQYTFHYYFINLGDEPISFTPWQVNSGYKTSTDAVCISGLGEEDGKPIEITLQPGEDVSYTRPYKIAGSASKNSMVMIDFNGKAAKGALGFGFSRADDAAEGLEKGFTHISPVRPLAPEAYGEFWPAAVPPAMLPPTGGGDDE